jgi:hypothetical protein
VLFEKLRKREGRMRNDRPTQNRTHQNRRRY